MAPLSMKNTAEFGKLWIRFAATYHAKKYLGSYSFACGGFVPSSCIVPLAAFIKEILFNPNVVKNYNHEFAIWFEHDEVQSKTIDELLAICQDVRHQSRLSNIHFCGRGTYEGDLRCLTACSAVDFSPRLTGIHPFQVDKLSHVMFSRDPHNATGDYWRT